MYITLYIIQFALYPAKGGGKNVKDGIAIRYVCFSSLHVQRIQKHAHRRFSNVIEGFAECPASLQHKILWSKRNAKDEIIISYLNSKRLLDSHIHICKRILFGGRDARKGMQWSFEIWKVVCTIFLECGI